jgi:TP901 family phage tail tape measure protein
MATQGGGNNTQTQAEIDLLYKSTGYQKEMQNLQNFAALIAEIKKDLGSVTMPAIKGMKGALADARELSHVISLMVATKNVAANASGEKQVLTAAVKQAQLNAADRALRVQEQFAKETQKTLQREAFLGTLKADEIKKHQQSLENLKAINKGLQQREQAGQKVDSTLKNLAKQHIKLIEDDIKDKKEEQNRRKLRQRVEEQVEAKKYARQAVEGTLSQSVLKEKLAKSDLIQLRAFERAINAEKVKAGYVETSQVRDFNKEVLARRSEITKPTISVKASEVVDNIKKGVFTQADVNHAVTQLRQQLNHAIKTGADRDTLVGLHQGLLDVRKAGSTQFNPPSPYQIAKETQEKNAAALLQNRLTDQSVKAASKAQLEAQLKASQIMSHPTKAAFGTPTYETEKAYQDLLKGRLAILKQQEVETKKAQQLEKVRSENSLSRIKKEMRATQDLGQLKILQRQLAARISAEFNADPKAKVLPFAEKLKQEISKAIAEASVKGTIYRDSLGKIKSGDVLGGLEGLSLRQLKKLQTQLLSHLDLTGLDTKVKENFKRALVQIDGTLKSAKRGELNLLGLEAPDTSKPLKRDKQLNIFEKARQGQLSIKDLQDFQVGSTDPKRTLKELRAIQNQIRKAELDPNLITTTDKAPNRLGNFIRTQISGLNQAIADLEKASKPVKALKEKDWSTQTREAVRSDINTLGQSRDPIARQNIREEAKRNFETKQNQAEYNKELIRHKASLNQATIQQMTTSTELAKATKAIQLDNKLHPKNQEANLALTEAIKQRTKDLNYQARLRDPNFKASEDLKQNQTGLRTTNVGSLLQGQDLSSARQVAKVNAELEKQRAIQAGIFDSKDKLLKLSPEEHKFAKATLNYQYAMNQNDKVKREEAARLLNVLSDIEKANRRATAANQNLANLAHKYTTTGEIRAIQDRAEAELARKVVAYRMRSTSYTEEELKRQQKLLDMAKSRDHLLTAQANRQDKERQHEKRLGQLTHLEGDGGASMAVIQAGFMMRSQVLGGLSSIFSGAFESAIQLDKAFRNLQAISASTNYEMATMKINLINVAQASKFSAAEVGETAVMLAQAGLSIQEIGASMKGIITLAQATGTDLAKSVDVVTSVLSIFNKSATETDTIVNQLTAALNESKLDINKMALGLQYAGNIANDSGVSFEELTAALGATANAGIRSGSTLGTGLRQMFIDLQKPNEKLTKRLETLGVTLDQVNFRSQGLEGVLRNLRNAGFSSADAFETFEVRSAAAFSALSGNLTDFHDLQEELADTNAAFDANNVQMEAFAVQLDHLKSNLGVLAAEGLKPVTAMLRDWTKGLAHSMENAEEGAGIIQLLTGAFAALMVGVTITWFTRLAWEIGKLTLAMGGLRALSGATTFGILGIVAALGTGIASWISYRSEVERLNTKLDEVKGKHNELKAALQSSEGTLNNVDEALKNLVDRYGVLKEDSGQTQTAAKNLMAQFEEFGLKIDDVANISIDNLIQKIQDLRSELSKDLKEKISDTATAKVKEILTEKSTAQGKLKQAKVFSGYFDFTSEGYKKFEQATNPAGSDPLGMSAFGRNPEFRKLYLQFFQGALRTQAMGKMLPPSEFSAPALKAKMQDLLAKSPNLSPTDIRILQEALDDLSLNYEDIRTVNTAQERISKTRKQEERDLYTLESDDFSKSAFGGEGRASAVARNFSETLNKLTKIKDPRARRKEQAIAAEQALKDSQAIISEAENELKTLEANKADSHQILTKQGQIARMREAEFEYRKYIQENDAQERKRQLQVLGFDLDAAKDAVATAKAIWSKSTGLNTEEKTYKEYEAKILAQQEIEDRINALRLIDNPDEATALAAVKRSRTSEKTKRGVERNSFRKHIEDTAAKAAVDNQEARSRQALEDKKREQDRFFKDLENKDKFVKMQEEAERRQAKAKAYIPLTSGNMFDTLNADEKKSAQAKANATGVSQEYSVFGQASNRFARQAARFDNQQLEKNLIQRKLANEVGALALLQQKERNINQEDYTKLVEKEAKLKAELKVLEDNAANSRLDQDKEAFERKKAEYELARDEVIAAQTYEQTLKDKMEERKNTIESLKETLQALNDQYNLIDTTMSAGVQSMTSGLSSIFSDWASGVIQNTEDVRDAFEALGKSVLQSMAKVVSDKIAQQFMGFLLNGLGSAFGVGTGEVNLGVSTGLGEVSLGASTGGLITPTGVKHFARGGEVTGTNIGRDSVPAYLQPNEYVVQRSAVQALGTPFLQQLNNITTGSLKQGASALGTAKPMVQNVMKASPPVNVYVVSPEQQRQMGQEDVVVALQDDILRGGTTKKLIKAVISGEV